MKNLLITLLCAAAFACVAQPAAGQDKCKKQSLRDGRFSVCAGAFWVRDNQVIDDILAIAFRDEAKGGGASIRIREITSTNSAQQMAKELELGIKRRIDQEQPPTGSISVTDFETAAGRSGKRIAYQIKREPNAAGGEKQITYFMNNPGGRVIQINVMIGYQSADGEKYVDDLIDPIVRTLKVNPPLPR